MYAVFWTVFCFTGVSKYIIFVKKHFETRSAQRMQNSAKTLQFCRLPMIKNSINSS